MGRVTATQAAKQLSELLNRVQYRGESFTVVRNEEPVAQLVPLALVRQVSVDDFMEVLRHLPQPDEACADDLDAIQAAQPPLRDSAWDT